ncbi:MAG: cupin domain-containing protein [Planctomycetota bacterium]|jgi:mannose-6-phosphate isomerase-like protein (cupin superfamily)
MRLSTLLIAAVICGVAPPATETDTVKTRTFERSDLLERLEARGRAYLPFLDVPTMKAGLYRLPAGATDRQEPHQLDEVYYVIEGKADFVSEDGRQAVAPGAVIYVRRGVEHRFEQIAEDLLVLVVFAGGS